MPILRLAYTALFLIAIDAVFVLWSQVGGQNHLDMMPWHWKLVLGAGAAFAATQAAMAAVSRERAWNGRTLRWLGILIALLAGCGLASYYCHINEEDSDEDEDPDAVSMVVAPNQILPASSTLQSASLLKPRRG